MTTPRERILQTKPWLKSTGAKSELGKVVCASNALKHGLSSKNVLIREAARWRRNRALMEGEIEDFMRRIRPFALTDRPLPGAFQTVLDYLGIDRETLFQQIRDEHQS